MLHKFTMQAPARAHHETSSLSFRARAILHDFMIELDAVKWRSSAEDCQIERGAVISARTHASEYRENNSGAGVEGEWLRRSLVCMHKEAERQRDMRIAEHYLHVRLDSHVGHTLSQLSKLLHLITELLALDIEELIDTALAEVQEIFGLGDFEAAPLIGLETCE